MKNIWAPWRIKYVACQKKSSGCIFCKKAKSKKDKQNLVLMRAKHSFVLMNVYPYNNGHIMAAPYRHVKDLNSLSNEEFIELFSLIKEMESKLKKVLSPDGFNIGINVGTAAGAGIRGHLHVHLVPRWTGDTGFMSVTSDIKIIAQSLAELYKVLTEK
ncbi:MAG TPA: HIT domain-containing protein [Candidatus Omnitrophica bacterium]|nr:HIT domain-containing protein [Candidatus Omnitrophota bacterium]